jgi:hypothetical protein
VLEWLPPDQIDDPAIGDELVVRLAPAEELVLEISATPKSDFLDHFAVNATALALPQSAVDAVAAGRHPQVSPARAVTLTHAVRKPLAAPAGTLTARRARDQTFATLDPSLPMFGIDTNSTGRVVITATWQDPDTQAVINHAPVASFTIGRGDQVFADDIRHDFADTRHRHVSYLVAAVSRFRPFFDAGEPDAGFVQSSTIGPVSIPSSARPPAVAVLSARPAFAWKETRTDGPPFALARRRLTGGIRIELQGAWFATGEGELLALVFAKTSIPAAGMEAFVTRAGGDPITIGFNIPFLFPSATVAAGDLPAREVMLPEAVEPVVVVVPFRPWRGDNGWVADIALPGLGDPATNAWPFVELALARYQPDSPPGLELSTVVKAELVQVMPERRLSVQQDGSSLTVSLQGVVSNEFTADVAKNTFSVVLEQLQAPAGTAADAVELAAIALPGGPSQPPATDGLPAWVAVDDQIHLGNVGPLQGNQGPPQAVVIALPAGLAGPLRLRVRESEADDAPQGVVEQSDELMERTIYSDIVMLPQMPRISR